MLASLAGLVRAMNCYYSNLIEGHDTHPVDIERALRNDYSLDARKRDLQLEAKAHIAVQEWIDGGGLGAGRAVKTEAIYRGELPRGDADAVVGTGERQARRIVSALLDKGVLVSDSSRSPLRLTFPAALASRWMPGLFPEQP
jgi:Fic family protein